MRAKTSKSGKVVKDESTPVSNPSCLSDAVSIHRFSDQETHTLRNNLLEWYDVSKRDLPWRKISHKDVNQRAYAVWVSEIMLQQTQVATVIDYYNKWMKKWPTLTALAESNIEEVNEAWSGLGYYSRGRRLFEGAQKVVSELDGQMPKTSQALVQQLPGVGRYTAGAISSIAFGEVSGLVDGNVIRVFSRLRLIGANVSRSDAMEAFWKLAHGVVDPSRPGDFNQALMELGATVCTPKTPQCGRCPVRNLCCAHHKSEMDKTTKRRKLCSEIKKEEREPDIPDIECLVPDCGLCLPPDTPWDSELGVMNFPRKPKKAAVKHEELNVVVIHTERLKAPPQFLICQRPQKGLLAGLWEFPTCTQESSASQLSKEVSKMCGVDAKHVQNLEHLGEINHVFSHVKHLYKVWSARLAPEIATQVCRCGEQPVRWLTDDELKDAAVSTGMRKVFGEYKKSTSETPSKKRKKEPDVVLQVKQTQASISDFFKRK